MPQVRKRFIVTDSIQLTYMTIVLLDRSIIIIIIAISFESPIFDVLRFFSVDC